MNLPPPHLALWLQIRVVWFRRLPSCGRLLSLVSPVRREWYRDSRGRLNWMMVSVGTLRHGSVTADARRAAGRRSASCVVPVDHSFRCRDGMEKANVAPTPSFGVAQIRP
jgi:hypothetical protein